MIFHVTTAAAWTAALEMGHYEAPSLSAEGFIHASLPAQVKGVLERYYNGVSDLLLLHIDEHKIAVPVKWELAPSINEMFPHIYGPLNLDAVVKVEPL